MALLDKRSARINVLVVDDESLARRNLTILLGRDPDIGVVTECASGLEAIEEIRKSKPDLVFLDVQMPECDGFDVLEFLGSDLPPTVIFVTAYDEYAIRAFEVSALDYLLKPFSDARFRSALNRAKDRFAQTASQQLRPVERLVVKSAGRVLFLDVADIDWIEAADYYACLHTGGDTQVMRRSLSELERDLGDGKFIRIHRSVIVNLDRIWGLELQNGGDYEVILKSKVRLRLSRRFRKRLQDRMGVGYRRTRSAELLKKFRASKHRHQPRHKWTSARRDTDMRQALPQAGTGWPELRARMLDYAAGDVRWREGKTAVYIFNAGPEIEQVQKDAYALFMSENGLGPLAFPSLKRMEDEVTGFGLSLLHGPDDAVGTITSGGTDSITMAMKAARDYARQERGVRGLLNIVLPRSAHPAFDKAAAMM